MSNGFGLKIAAPFFVMSGFLPPVTRRNSGDLFFVTIPGEIMRIRYLVFFLLSLTFLPAKAAYADCVLAGTAVCDSVSCGGRTFKAGQVIHNADHGVLQVCLADNTWKALHKAVPPPDCPNVGDVCGSDGTIYAGEFNGYKLYAAADNAPSNRIWGPNPSTSGMGFCGSPFTGGSCDTGRENTQLLKDHASTFPAAEYCADLVAHGHDDWYLPSRNELVVLYSNLYVGHTDGAYNFQHSEWPILYWSSTESASTSAFTVQFNDDGGWANANVKQIGSKVRCVRR